MQIEDNRKKVTGVMLNDLPYGGVFEYEGEIYIHGNVGNCTKLSDGKRINIAASYKVTYLPNAKVVIGD